MTYAVSPFTLHQPRTVADVMAALKQHPDALYLAGGTDLMVNIRRRIRERVLTPAPAARPLSDCAERGDTCMRPAKQTP